MKKINRVSIIVFACLFGICIILSCNSQKSEKEGQEGQDSISEEQSEGSNGPVSEVTINENIFGQWGITKFICNGSDMTQFKVYGADYSLQFSQPNLMSEVKNSIKTDIRFNIIDNSIVNQENNEVHYKIASISNDKLVLLKEDQSGKTELILKKIN